MSKLIEMVKSVLDKYELPYYSYDSDGDNVIRQNFNGSSMAIGIDEENAFIKFECCLSLSLALAKPDNMPQAYQVRSPW